MPRRRAEAEARNIVERWLLSIANADIPSYSWTTVYRIPPIAHPINVKLADELFAKHYTTTPAAARSLTQSILSMVDAVIAAPPARDDRWSASCCTSALAYREFSTPVDVRLARLIEIGGCNAAVRVAMRYAAVGGTGQQWGLPQYHHDYLYEMHGVRGEAFASPLNSRYLGKPNAHFCSLFVDTDACYGSLGSFFAQDMHALRGNWTVNPPYVESLMARAAAKVCDSMTYDHPQTVFAIMPHWTDTASYELYHRSPFLVSEMLMLPHQYYYESPSGARIDTNVPSIYFALSSEAAEVRATLPAALRHVMLA
jgi:hypothetical protein